MYSDLLLTPTGCDDESARLLSVRLATSAIRRGIPESDLLETLEALGLAKPAAPLLREGRSAYGRVRPVPAPARAKPEAKVCRTAGHDLSQGSPNVYTDPTTGRIKCKLCRQRTERNRRAKVKGARAPVAKPDPDLCRCPDEKHRLVTAPNGRRSCPVASGVRRRASRAKAKEVRTGETS